MCYGDDSRPPFPPVSGGSPAEAAAITLQSADGAHFMAHRARAPKPSGNGIVILPDVRGLHEFYRELAVRFAEAGIDAIAIDYFARTAETDNRDESFAYRPHVDQTTQANIASDVAAAIADLRSPAGGSVSRVFTVGFCFGGSTSWRQSAAQPGLAGAIGLYGMPVRARDVIDDMKAPLLLLVAGADFTPVSELEKFDQELTDAGVPHKMVVYEGAPHSFFDRTFAEHEAACDDAWRQIFSFIESPPRSGQ